MKKLILEKADGDQFYYEVREGVFQTLNRILWDDSIDGPMPDVLPNLGALVREGNQLRVDPAKLAALQAKIAAQVAADAAIAARKLRLRNDVAGANSIPALRSLIADLVAELGI